MPPRTLTLCATPVLMAALALGGCGRRDEGFDPAARGNSDGTTVAQSSGTDTGDPMQKDARLAKDAPKDAANEAKDTSRDAADQATNKVADALITTNVNAELAKDPTLSAVHIDVDTNGGRVALRGSAPDAESKARAAQLATGVKGVVSVENQLTVQGKG